MNFCRGIDTIIGDKDDGCWCGNSERVNSQLMTSRFDKTLDPTMPTQRVTLNKQTKNNINAIENSIKKNEKVDTRHKVSLSKITSKGKYSNKFLSGNNTGTHQTNPKFTIPTIQTPVAYRRNNLDVFKGQQNFKNDESNRKTSNKLLSNTFVGSVQSGAYPSQRYFASKPSSADIYNHSKTYKQQQTMDPTNVTINSLKNTPQFSQNQRYIQYKVNNSSNGEKYRALFSQKMNHNTRIQNVGRTNILKKQQKIDCSNQNIQQQVELKKTVNENKKKFEEEKNQNKAEIVNAEIKKLQKKISAEKQISNLIKIENKGKDEQKYYESENKKHNTEINKKKEEQWNYEDQFIKYKDYLQASNSTAMRNTNRIKNQIMRGKNAKDNGLLQKITTAHSVYEEPQTQKNVVEQSIIIVDFFNPEGKVKQYIEQDLKKRYQKQPQ